MAPNARLRLALANATHPAYISPFHSSQGALAMGDRDSKSKFSKRGDGDDKPAPAKEAAGLSGMARRFATVEAPPAPKPAKPGKAGVKDK